MTLITLLTANGQLQPALLFTCVCVLFAVLQDIAISSMSRYVSPINPAVFPHLSVVLLSIGIFFMAWFFVYPLTGSL